MSLMSEAIAGLEANGYTRDSIKNIIESMLKAAYKRKFNTDENAIVKFNDDMSDVALYSRKVVMNGIYDPVTEIELEEALKLGADCEEGDEIDILIDPKQEFERSAVAVGKQNARQELNQTMLDKLYEEYKDRIGQIVTGAFLREHNGNIYVDMGKVEGVLPVKYQSPREIYKMGDKIKAFCFDARKTAKSGMQLMLSRAAPELVKAILEVEIPEVADGTIEVVKIVRKAGFRCKIAVTTNHDDVDPVGSCVGPKGVRIQNVINELNGERIDVLRYSDDAMEFVKTSLSPAVVSRVVLKDIETRQAMAIVPDTQFSIAIGKQGLNVGLAKQLCDWQIDVVSESEAAEMDLSVYDNKKAAINLFNQNIPKLPQEQTGQQNILKTLEGVELRVADLLHSAGIDDIQQYIAARNDGVVKGISGITQEDIQTLDAITGYSEKEQEGQTAQDVTLKAQESQETQQDQQTEDTEEEEYFCPECGAKITLDMTKCPNCGVEFTFEEEEE